MKKKLLAVSLVTVALTACGGNTTQTTISYGKYPVVNVKTSAEVLDPSDYEEGHMRDSATLFNKFYGQFYEVYQDVDDAENVSERYALQAIAEAKLLENGTMLPAQANGGNYAISRIVPRTITPVLWGQDNYRYHNVMIKNGNPLKKSERSELTALYNGIEASATPASGKQAEYEAAVRNWFVTKGYTFNRTYTLFYNGVAKTADCFATYKAADTEPLVNTFDGLVEYDDFNNVQPALAESWTHDPVAKTYTFKIRDGLKWTSRDGTEVADVKADDFVAGFQHMLDAKGGLQGLVFDLIDGALEYYLAPAATKDFSVVGVTADNAANTVTYKLIDDVPYFLTMLGYSIFAPLSRQYYTSQGGQFGSEYQPSAETYNYGKDYDHIAYCGPYLIKTFVDKSTYEFEKNTKYWNKDNINVDKIVWLYNDGKDPLKPYNSMKEETVASCGLVSAAVELAKKDGLFNDYAYVSAVDAGTYPFFINVNRNGYANFDDPNKAVSPKSDEQKLSSKAALLNTNIRLGLCFAIDRVAYFAQAVGEDVAVNAVTNSYTPGTYVRTTEEVTVAINNRTYTFPAGTYYGEIMQAQIDADGLPMKVWNPNGGELGTGSSIGFDGWHNVDAAVSYFKKGVEELAELGVEVSASKPLVLDLTTASSNATTDNEIKALGASLKNVFGDLIQINYVDAGLIDDLYSAEYYPDYGHELNCDLCTVSGWGPDYGDPKTYLDCFLPQDGGMLKCNGIF